MTSCPELAIFNLQHGMRLIWEKLPDNFQTKWRSRYLRHEYETGSPPDFALLIEFLERFVKEVSHPSFVNVNKTPLYRSVRALVTVNESPEKAILNCKYHDSDTHSILDCKAFAKLPFLDRKKFVIDNRLCFICLESHFSDKCPNKSHVKCSKCSKSHCSSMHYDNVSPQTNSKFDSESHIKNSCTKICGSPNSHKICSKTLHVEITVEGHSKTLNCLCILDEQSNASFCDPELVKYFNITPVQTNYSLSTMTSRRNLSGQKVSNLLIRGIGCSKWFSLPPLLTHPNLPDTKSEMATRDIVSEHKHIRRFARHFPVSHPEAEVMILVGANAGDLMRTKPFGNVYPFVHETPLGYALVGPSCSKKDVPNDSPSVLRALRTSLETVNCDHTSADIIFEKDVFPCLGKFPFKSFIDDDLPGPSQEDTKFIQLMEREVTVNDRGNLQLPLPLRDDAKLPDNQSAVYYRTKNTLSKLLRSPEKLTASLNAFEVYLKSGHVEEITSEEGQPNFTYYIPIFPVYQEPKKKTRLVFDSSAIYHGKSLNSALMQGPDVNNSLIGVLLRFRLDEVAVVADIEQMFHAFYVPQDQTNLLRFFWFSENNPSKDIVPFRAKVHIFGNKPSPAIATFALKYTTLHPDAQSKSEACNFIRDNFYVDDALYSCDSTQNAVQVLKDARDILGHYNIRLHKIMSSHPAVVEKFPQSEVGNMDDAFNLTSEHSPNKTLGVVWSPKADTLSLSPNIPQREYTKRGLLAVVSSVYDPLNFVCPFMLRGRLLLRKIIPPKGFTDPDVVDLDWDDPLPAKFFGEWKVFVESLKDACSINIRRCYKPHNFGVSTHNEVHCFSDASIEAIGFVIYLRQFNSIGEVSVSFLFANSKVTPRSANTIPRLELCAALEAADAVTKVKAELNLDIHACYFYTDSKIVLGYLANSEKRFSRYVSRRVENILRQSLLSQWNHIEGAANVGDLASRPQTMKNLLDSDWLTGPTFLQSRDPLEETTFVNNDVQELPELKCCTNLSHEVPPISNDTVNHICSITNSWFRARRILANVLKFVHLLKMRGRMCPGCEVCNLNLTHSATVFIQASQCIFKSTIDKLQSGSCLPASDKLSSLSPFIDDAGTLRVGGRLKHSAFPADVNNPVLLPPHSAVTSMILQDCHVQVGHQGRHLTGGRVRQCGYHIHKGSSAIKNFINQCVTCRRLRGKCQDQLMADLPPDRLEETPPFTNVGIDLFGPYLIHDGKTTRTQRSTKKVWGLMITCLVSRAIHIELVPYLDTPSLQLALRRFYALRGTCKRIRSDQGTNLMGARNQLFDIQQLKTDALKSGIEWEVNPPAASNMGGVWERKIGSVKRIMESKLYLCDKSSLSRDELNTYLQECASIINNTPLWEVSTHPDDPSPLSPANLLTLRDSPNPAPLESFTESDLNSYGKNRWHRVMFLCDEFWRRWQSHYLALLQRRNRWLKPNHAIQIGDIVLVKGTNKRNDWPMGRIASIKYSKDNLVRSAVIRLPSKDSGKPRYLERSIRDTVLLVSSPPE